LISGSMSLAISGEPRAFLMRIDPQGAIEWQEILGSEYDSSGRFTLTSLSKDIFFADITRKYSSNWDILFMKTDPWGNIPISCDLSSELDFIVSDPGLSAADSHIVAIPFDAEATPLNIQPLVTNVQPEILCSSETELRYLAAAANTQGANGTHWKTDAVVYNPNTAPVALTYTYTSQASDGPAITVQETLSAGWVQGHEDIVGELFHMPDSAGTIRVESDQPVQLSSRTYNDQGEKGTYGQFVDGLMEGEGIGQGAKGYLIGLQNDDPYRTNLGFAEMRGIATTVNLSIYDGEHQLLCSDGVTVAPFSWTQQPLAGYTAAPGGNYTAEVEWVSGGAVAAYASVVDNATGDPIYMPAQKESLMAGQTQYLIPVVAKTSGVNGTNWKSDVWIYNPLDAAQTLQLTYSDAETIQTQELEVNGGEAFEIRNICETFFQGLSGDRFGSLKIQTQDGLALASRTYNDQGSSGTYGQYVPAKKNWELLQANFAQTLVGLMNTEEYRTNVGFSPISSDGSKIEVLIYDSQGNILGQKYYDVPGSGVMQINDIFADFEITSSVTNALVKIINISGSPLYCYASRIDNYTGDSIFINR
jgi:hypothetical protein